MEDGIYEFSGSYSEFNRYKVAILISTFVSPDQPHNHSMCVLIRCSEHIVNWDVHHSQTTNL